MRAEQRYIRQKKELADVKRAASRIYPNYHLPWEDLYHAWEIGSGRVGRTSALTMDEKVKCAATAVARHKLTRYDDLLKSKVPRDEARKQVTQTVWDWLNFWSGRKNEQPEPQTPTALHFATEPRKRSKAPPPLKTSPTLFGGAMNWVAKLVSPRKTAFASPPETASYQPSLKSVPIGAIPAKKPKPTLKINTDRVSKTKRKPKTSKVKFSDKINFSSPPPDWTPSPPMNSRTKLQIDDWTAQFIADRRRAEHVHCKASEGRTTTGPTWASEPAAKKSKPAIRDKTAPAAMLSQPKFTPQPTANKAKPAMQDKTAPAAMLRQRKFAPTPTKSQALATKKPIKTPVIKLKSAVPGVKRSVGRPPKVVKANRSKKAKTPGPIPAYHARKPTAKKSQGKMVGRKVAMTPRRSSRQSPPSAKNLNGY